eukprot:jgi/Ulvmu1/9560/UM053_0049.1
MSSSGGATKRSHRALPQRSILRSLTAPKKAGQPRSLALMLGTLAVIFTLYVLALIVTPRLLAPSPRWPDQRTEGSHGRNDAQVAKYPNHYDKPTLGETLPSDSIADDQGYSFKMLEPGSLSYKDMPWCPGVPEPTEAELAPIDRRFNSLIILGAQKAGTTWLFDALDSHPHFHGAHHGFRRGRDKWRKEVHFFDQWPGGTGRDYIACFPLPVRTAALNNKPHVLMDASPEYMLTPVAAPRVQAIVPQARFVIILREPAERTLSAWNMVNRTLCARAKPSDHCKVPPFQDTVDGDLDPKGRPECIFGTAGGSRTWGDCWRCYYPTFQKKKCHAAPAAVQDAHRGCEPPSVPTTHVAYYAAQLAWWLAFFPPERFLILTSAELHSPDRQLQALNSVLEHVGLEGAERFTADMVANISGYQGHYDHSLDPATQATMADLHRHFDRPSADLQRLMDTYFPDLDFRGLEPEL